MRPIGTAQELERRRRRAVELMDEGESPTVIARILGVCRTSLYRWKAMARSSPDGLAATPHPGPKSRLSADQMAQLEGLLKEGAKAHGWKTQLWTAERVADLIRRRFAIRFHPEHARKILKRRLKWTSQKPQRRAKERDEATIAH
jgi:transposase